jgi:hypothetical protein
MVKHSQRKKMLYIIVIASSFILTLPTKSNTNMVTNHKPYFSNDNELKKMGPVHTVKMTKYILGESR